MKKISSSIFIALFIYILSGCSASKPVLKEDPNGVIERGLGSHYGALSEGNYTASGELYEHNKLTASHATLPFDTYVKVTNIENGRSVVVRINDRPNPGEDKIIGVSGEAAKQLRMIGKGVVEVELKPLIPFNSSSRRSVYTATQPTSTSPSTTYTGITETELPYNEPVATTSQTKALSTAPIISEQGTAAYYGDKYQGFPTRSGELYDRNKLTASHPSLPMNTQVLVTNLKNGKQVVVRINDRMAAGKGRIIDVSGVAAEQLDMVLDGTANVTLAILNQPVTDAMAQPISPEPVTPPPVSTISPTASYDTQPSSPPNTYGGNWTLQLAAVESYLLIQDHMKRLGAEAYYEEAIINGKQMYRLYYGHWATRQEAMANRQQFLNQGYTGAFAKEKTN